MKNCARTTESTIRRKMRLAACGSRWKTWASNGAKRLAELENVLEMDDLPPKRVPSLTVIDERRARAGV